MKQLIALSILLGLAWIPVTAQPAIPRTLYVTPDVPTDDPGGSSTIFLPWDVVRYRAGLYTRILSLPPGTMIDAIHKMDRPNRWLFSVEVPTELPPGSGVVYQPEDVIQYDGSTFGMYFDGSAAGIRPGTNVDAVFLARDGSNDLILSFDIPTTIGATTYEPADLVRVSALGFSLFFDASASGAGIAISDNVIAADSCWRTATRVTVLGLDIPSDLLPSTGPPTYLPGQFASWDGVGYGLYETLLGWPISSEVNALACQAPPGRVYDRAVYPFLIILDKNTVVAGNIRIGWTQSCCSGAEDYGIYEGTVGTWTSHVSRTCSDIGFDFTEELAPQAASSYYLVVPYNLDREGSYGMDFVRSRLPQSIERPQAALPAARCTPLQDLTPCPP